MRKRSGYQEFSVISHTIQN